MQTLLPQVPGMTHASAPDTLGFIMAFEAGELDEDEIVKGMQDLIDTGIVWQLQGSYGRLAMQLIERGLCRRRLSA